MKIKELKSEGLTHELEVTVPANDIDERVEARLKEVGKTIRLPGFRPGKAPMNILRQRFGKNVMGEILEKTVNETSGQALEKQKIKPALQPKIEVKEFDEGQDLIYTMAVEAVPEFEIKNFKGLKLEKQIAKPDEDSVEEALKNLAAGRQETQPITGKRGAKEGDVVVIDFHGRTADDNVEHEGMHAHGHYLRLGEGQFIPGFEDQLIGKKAGEKVEVKVTFPENYKADLAGRDAIFDVDIQEIREPVEAEINDDLAEAFGMDDLNALKDAVRERVQQEYDNQSQMLLKRQVLDYLDDEHKFEVPAGMLEMEYESIIQQVEMEHQQAGGQGSLTDEEKEELKDIAERRVRLGLILSEIGAQNSIQITDPELKKAVVAEAQKYPGQEKAVFDYFSQNRQALESLRAPLYEQKVVDFILELADVTEKEVSKDKLMADPDEQDEQKPKKKSSAKKKTSSKKKDSTENKPAAKKKTSSDKKPAAKKKSPEKKAVSKPKAKTPAKKTAAKKKS